MANTGPNWVPDGQLNHATGKVNPAPYQGLSALDGANTIATTVEDTHASGWTQPSVSNGIKYSEEEIFKADFKDVFAVVDPNQTGPDKHRVIYTFYWGCTWSNYSYQMTAAQGAPAGVVVCASSSMPGVGLGMLTGYGDGVNFSNVTLK